MEQSPGTNYNIKTDYAHQHNMKVKSRGASVGWDPAGGSSEEYRLEFRCAKWTSGKILPSNSI